MKSVNSTKGAPHLLTRKGKGWFLRPARHARSRWDRFMGLMGENPPAFTYGLVFHLEKSSIVGASIHMLFMRMPIDVIWMDNQQKIVEWKTNIPPWSLNHSPRVPASYIVELPAGTIHRAQEFREGQPIEW
ncbi:MAG: DUF192 domain-containing protein [archaeon]